MMELIVVTLFVFLIVIFLMAVGVIFGRKPISGSCGGIAQSGLDGECKICGRTKPETCNEVGIARSKEAFDNSLAVDASKNMVRGDGHNKIS